MGKVLEFVRYRRCQHRRTQPSAATDAETVTIYTLEGKRQTMKKADVQSLPSGIYIVDGKKVVVK